MSGQQSAGADATGQGSRMAVGEPARNLAARNLAARNLAASEPAGGDPGPAVPPLPVREAGAAVPRLPVRDPGTSQARAPGGHIRALDDLETLRRVLAALQGL